MKVLKGKVIDGRVEVQGGELQEGLSVTILVSEGETSFTMTREEVAELQTSINQAAQGEVVDGWELLSQLQA